MHRTVQCVRGKKMYQKKNNNTTICTYFNGPVLFGIQVYKSYTSVVQVEGLHQASKLSVKHRVIVTLDHYSVAQHTASKKSGACNMTTRILSST